VNIHSKILHTNGIVFHKLWNDVPFLCSCKCYGIHIFYENKFWGKTLSYGIRTNSLDNAH